MNKLSKIFTDLHMNYPYFEYTSAEFEVLLKKMENRTESTHFDFYSFYQTVLFQSEKSDKDILFISNYILNTKKAA